MGRGTAVRGFRPSRAPLAPAPGGRNSDFPDPAAGTDEHPQFDCGAVVAWLLAHDKQQAFSGSDGAATMRWYRKSTATADESVRGGAWTAGDLTVCGTCHADDVAREQAARLPAAVPPPSEDDREPARPGHGLFRRRG
ncbi:hypothetical protein AB0F11_02000 [Streptomyces sp. NPDC032472]|uniref:hypothetical protein n=1 Tax=Streptomyces sp. NPDC032472 TaxID=3155018 RepID=UPI003401B096